MSATQAASSSASAGRSAGAAHAGVPSRCPSRPPPYTVGRAQHQLGRPAADVDDEDRVAGCGPKVADGAVEGERRLLVTGDDLGLDAQPGADAGDEDVGVLGVPGGRGGAEPDPGHAVRGDQRGVLVDRGEGPLQRLVREPPGARRRPGPVGPSASRARPRRGPESGTVPIRSLIVLVPQSIAATRTARTPTTHRAGPAPRRRAGCTPGPGPSDWPARTCRHFTRSGMPPAEIPSISGTSCPAPGRARRGPRGSARCALAYAAARSGSSSSRASISFIRPDPSSVPIREAARGQVR